MTLPLGLVLWGGFWASEDLIETEEEEGGGEDCCEHCLGVSRLVV